MPRLLKLSCGSAFLLSACIAQADMSVVSACQQATDKSLPKTAPVIETEEGEVVIFSNTVDFQEETYLKLDGNVEIIRGDVRVYSDQADINQTTQHASLEGKVKVAGPALQVSGDSAHLNMESKQTEVSNAEFLSDMTRIRGKAKRIRVPNTHQLNVEDGFFTTCQPGDKAWSFASSDIKLDSETGRGIAKHTRFQIYDVPVLYVPWFTFAIDDRRTSGFLYPQIGTANTGDGLFISTPYYFNIRPDMDATLTPSVISGRGLHNELETRYLSQWGQSDLALGYIAKDKTFVDEQADLNKRDDGERWGLSFEQGIQFDTDFGQWMGSIDYSAVSDADYLDDLNQGLQIENQDYLDRRGELALNYDTWRLKIILQQYAILDDDTEQEETPFQRLPEVDFQYNKLFGDLHLNWASNYVYFYRDNAELSGDDRTYGSRLRMRPSAALPLQKSWGYLIPKVSIDHTNYLLKSYGPEDNHLDRTVVISELDTGLYFDRQTRFGDRPIRHSLEPRFYYVHSNAGDQSDIPVFDSDLPNFYLDRLFTPDRFIGGDRIADENRYTLGLTTRFSDLTAGRDISTFSIAYIHHLEDSQVGLFNQGLVQEADKQYAAAISFSPRENVNLYSSALWDDRREEMLESYSSVSYHSDDYGYLLNLAHRYRDGEETEAGIEQSDSSFIAPVSEQISVLGRWRYEFNQHRTIGTLAGLEYRSCCWRVQVLGQRYLTDDRDIENGVLFRFQLIGLGSYGEDSDLMDEQIPGYIAREKYFH